VTGEASQRPRTSRILAARSPLEKGGTINGRLAAVRRLAYEAADAGLLSPELTACIRRVKGARKANYNWRR
jgi:hypothetical protein